MARNGTTRSANRGTFRPGDPRAGRKPGSVNKATQDIRDLAQQLLTDPGYLAALQKRLQEGTAGRIEELLYQYAWGRPPERLPDPEARGRPRDDPEVISIDVRSHGDAHQAV